MTRITSKVKTDRSINRYMRALGSLEKAESASRSSRSLHPTQSSLRPDITPAKKFTPKRTLSGGAVEAVQPGKKYKSGAIQGVPARTEVHGNWSQISKFLKSASKGVKGLSFLEPFRMAKEMKKGVDYRNRKVEKM